MIIFEMLLVACTWVAVLGQAVAATATAEGMLRGSVISGREAVHGVLPQEHPARDNPGRGIYAGGSSNPACQTSKAVKVPVYVTFQAWYGMKGRWAWYPQVHGSHGEWEFFNGAGGACKCNDTLLSKYSDQLKRYDWPDSCEKYNQRWHDQKWMTPDGDPGLMLYPPIGGPYDPKDVTDMDMIAKVMWDYCISGVIIDYQAEHQNIAKDPREQPTLKAVVQIAKSMAKYKLRWAVMPDSMTVAWNDAVWKTMLDKLQEELTPEVLDYYMVIKGKKAILPFTNFEPSERVAGPGAMQLPSKDFLENPDNSGKNSFCGTNGKNCSFFINTGWWGGTHLAPTIDHYREYSGISGDQLGLFLWGPFMYPFGGNATNPHRYEDPQQTLKLALDPDYAKNMYDNALLNYIEQYRATAGAVGSTTPGYLPYSNTFSCKVGFSKEMMVNFLKDCEARSDTLGVCRVDSWNDFGDVSVIAPSFFCGRAGDPKFEPFEFLDAIRDHVMGNN